MIDQFEEKKVVDYLKVLEIGKRVLIRFGHGLGDTVLFYPLMKKLRELFPNITIDIYVECGQEDIIRSPVDMDDPTYDLVFSLNYPMSEGSELMKVEKCCIEEIGMVFPLDIAAVPDYLPNYPNPIVAVHFQGTSLPESVGCPYDTAKTIWHEIIDVGLVPLEIHYVHMFHNPVNAKYDFITSTIREFTPDIRSLIGIIRNSFAFVGVASGPFCIALSTIPERTLYLEKHHELKCYDINPSIQKISILPGKYVAGTVFNFLSDLIAKYGYKDWRI